MTDDPRAKTAADFSALTLYALGQLPLAAKLADGAFLTYRMVCTGFPTGAMIMVRLDIKTDGTADLTAREHIGGENHETTGSLPASAVDRFLQLIGRPNFWTPIGDSQTPGVVVLDGSYWLLEGVGGNGHHAVFWRGVDAGPYAEVARYLTDDLAHFRDFSQPIPPATPHRH